jgi:hypothetical protein
MRNGVITAFLCAVLSLCSAVSAASRTLRPGDVWGLAEDFVLTGDDVLEVRGTPEKLCRIDANGGTIRTARDWKGKIHLEYCELRSLGTAKAPALDLTAAGDGEQITIDHCDFHACGPIYLTNEGNSASLFRQNRLRASSMLPVTNLPDQSPPVFRAHGNSPARKLFQGNRVEKSIVEFEGARNWLIGGDRDEDANVITGMRGSLSITRCADIAIRGNYVHTEIPSFRWSQVHTLMVGQSTGLVVEQNVLRHGQWVVRGLSGEFRYNLVLDADGHNFIIGPRAGTHIHHNIFARYCTVDPNLNATIAVIYKGDDIQIYNNTFDAGGKDLARPWHVPAIEVGADGFVANLRNNAFINHPTRFHSGTAIIRPGFSEKLADGPGPERLGYADYNLFHNPDAASRRNYGLAVAGKTERQDSGFALHDVPAKGEKNAQVDPRFAGPIPTKFPFDDDDICAGKVTVRQILSAYRKAYAPATDSPLLAAGDPADGAGSYIGAVSGESSSPSIGAKP